MQFRIVNRLTGEDLDPVEFAKDLTERGKQFRWADLFNDELTDLKIVPVESASFVPGQRVMLTADALEEHGHQHEGSAYVITGRSISPETNRTLYHLDGVEQPLTSADLYSA